MYSLILSKWQIPSCLSALSPERWKETSLQNLNRTSWVLRAITFQTKSTWIWEMDGSDLLPRTKNWIAIKRCQGGICSDAIEQKYSIGFDGTIFSTQSATFRRYIASYLWLYSIRWGSQSSAQLCTFKSGLHYYSSVWLSFSTRTGRRKCKVMFMVTVLILSGRLVLVMQTLGAIVPGALGSKASSSTWAVILTST